MADAVQSEPTPLFRRHAAIFIAGTVFIDAMGIGIIIPVTPDLLRELTDLPLSSAALWGGYLAFSYAVMQFLFGPIIGNLSDRFGRRPVLLTSVAALAVDYLIMGFAQSLAVLFIGRVLAGIAGATYATANAFMADVSPPEKRAANFGLIGAAFGFGFVIGPVIGGLAGEIGTRVPFFVAAGMAALNFVYGWFVLRETVTVEKRRPFVWARANPFGAVKHIRKVPMVAGFILTFFFYELAHFVYPAVWAYYTIETFSWSTAEVGLSLAVVGLMMGVVQGGLIRVALSRFGEAKTALIGYGASLIALTGLGFTSSAWVVYALMPITALGLFAGPAINGVMANLTPNNAQGELQGILASTKAAVIILSPLVMTQLFGFFTRAETPIYLPGAPFLAAAVLMMLSMLLFRRAWRRSSVGV